MDAVHGVTNVFHQYVLPEPVTLVVEGNGAERFVRITPGSPGALVEHGWRSVSSGNVEKWALAAPAERFETPELNGAIQRFCVLVTTWLDGDEHEVEQTRQSFIGRA